MAVFSLVLSLASSATTGGPGVDRLSVTVASLTSLTVYLFPLPALLMSSDAVTGEAERGALPLLLAYPIAREEILIGKLLAHLAILTLAVLLGHGLATTVDLWTDENAPDGLTRALIDTGEMFALPETAWLVQLTDRELALQSRALATSPPRA